MRAPWFALRKSPRQERGRRPAPFWYGLPHLERLEDRIVPALVPTVTLPPPTTALPNNTQFVSVDLATANGTIGTVRGPLERPLRV
jgi:hypothetical protein